MANTQQCPECGAELAADVPEGLCPRCLLKQGIGSQPPRSPSQKVDETTTHSPASGAFVAPSPDLLAPHFPQLEILELLGQGGMGAVYKARQTRLDRLVAVKILPRETAGDPDFAERFAREAKALARLSHPQIVGIYDFGETEGLFYFVMEFVDGANLREMLRSGELTSREVLEIVPQICEALQYAHNEDFVHRDIKPENILIDKRGRVKIADFGLAKLLGVKADYKLTGTQQVMGTPQYMAPEQIETPQQVDHRADIYSLGVVFYEMLTGELPIGRFEPPSHRVQVDVRLDEVVLKTLEKRPERRYQHASEVKTAVESMKDSPKAVSDLPSPPPAGQVEADVKPQLSRNALTGKPVRWSDLPADVRRAALWKLGGVTAGLVVCVAFVCYLNVVQFDNEGFEVKLQPQSAAFKCLGLTGQFSATHTRFGTVFQNEARGTMPLRIEVEPNTGPKLGMTIDLPNLRAHLNKLHEPVFDREVFVTWMHDALKIETANPEVQIEITELVALVKSYSHRPPTTWQEFELKIEGELKHFQMLSWGDGGGVHQGNLSMLLVVIALVIYAILLSYIYHTSLKSGRAYLITS